VLRAGNIQGIGAATTRNFQQPIQAIIPWATNYFTETLISRVRAEFGDAFWGFWMLGGMSGGGMGFIFAPEKKTHVSWNTPCPSQWSRSSMILPSMSAERLRICWKEARR
jgi:hypothetical protein